MYFVNVASMKIHIIIFICISISSVQSTGSNSSLFESKVLSDYPGDELFSVKYIGYILMGVAKKKRVTTANFINEGNCLVTKDWAMAVEENKEIYFAETPVFPEKDRYSIDSVFYKDVDDEVAAFWGVLKLSRDVKGKKHNFKIVNPRDFGLEMEREYYAGGWVHTLNQFPFSKYLTVKLSPFGVCGKEIRRAYLKTLHNLACGIVKGGSLQKVDDGTGLFLNDEELLGITVRFPDKVYKYAIFALLHNDAKFILQFVKRKPGYSDSSNKGKGKGIGEVKGKGKAPVDMYPKHPAYMDTSDPGLMGVSGQGQTDGYGLSHVIAHHRGQAGARKKDKMPTYDQNLMGAYGQGQTDQGDLSHIFDHHTGHPGARKEGYSDAWNQIQMDTHHQYPMGAHYQDLMGAYGQGQTDPGDLSYMVDHHRGQVGARRKGYADAWNQNQMGASNINPIGTHHRGQTGAEDPNLVGTYGQGEIDSYQPSYTSPQGTSDVDELSKMFSCSRLITTRGNQSPDRRHVHDGSHSAMSYHTAVRKLKAQKDTSFLDTSRITDVNLPKNPRSRSKRKEK